MDIDVKRTERGFCLLTFFDYYDQECSLQESSLAEEAAIWFGITDANPQILASTVIPNGTGWIKYDVPEDVLLSTRMHLTREQVGKLLPILQHFVNTGDVIEI